MSVSLALIPVALTLRHVMGKSNFSTWVESMQDRIPTSFHNESELFRAVSHAGYDAEKLGGSIQTLFDNERHFMYWELDNGKWTAIFEKSDDRQQIKQFMANINQAAGRQVFTEVELSARTTIHAPAPIFPTNFRDGDLLFRTLKDFGVNPVRLDSSIECTVENSHLIFRQTQDSPFHVEIRNAPDLNKVFEYLSDLDEDYKRCLQSIVYEKLKERAARQNMAIESEEVLEDNSIVVTLNIRG